MLHPTLIRNMTLEEFKHYLSTGEIKSIPSDVLTEQLDEAYRQGYSDGKAEALE